MINNISRKGLVVGTVAAFALSSISAAPAFAATVGTGSAVATTYAGTGTSIVEGTDFDVTVFADPAKAYWSQTSASGYAFTSSTITRYTFTNYTSGGYATSSYYQWLPTGSATVDDWSNNGLGADDPAGVYITEAVAASTATSVGFTASTDGVSIDAQNPGDTQFTLAAGSITADKDITFTPFISVDNDGAFDAAAGDVTGTPLTVKFLNNTGSLLSAALTGTVVSTTTQDLKVSVTGPTGVNMTQMDDDLEVLVSRSSTYVDDGDLTTNDSNVAETSSWPGVGTGYYTARVYNKADTSPANNTVAYSAQSSEVIIGQISPDSKITGISFVDAVSANLTSNREVRAGTKSFDVEAQLYTTDGADDGTSDDAYAKSGVSVKYTAVLNNAAADAEIKINGTVITGSGVNVTVPTDAKGVAKVTITSKNGADNDSIILTAQVLTASGIVTANCVDDWYWNTAYIENFWETHDVGYSDNVLGTTRNSQVTLNYEVTDQFGQPWSKAGYEYVIHLYDDEDSSTEINTTGALVNGKASVTFTNVDLPGVNYDVYAEIDERPTTVLSPSWSYDIYDSYWTYMYVNHINTVGSLSAALNLDSTNINTEDFIAFNDNLADWDTTLAGEVEDNESYLYGTVVDSNNVPLAGVPVTISASGVQFTDDNVYSIGSFTSYTDSNGYYEVEFFTHKAGDNVFTVTSGGKSSTVTATYNNPTDLHATDVLTVVAPKAVQAGTVTPVSVKLVDKFGNGITGAAIALGLVGEGYLSSYSVSTDKGAASVVLINGVNDTSKATITAATNHSYADNRVNKSFSQTVTTGSVATVKASSVKGRLLVDVDNSRNETVRVYVDGKLVKKVVASAHHQLFKINGLKKGKHKVTVTSDYQNLVTGFKVTIK